MRKSGKGIDMKPADKDRLIIAIDKLDALTCWDEDEYRKHFGVTKATKSKELRIEIREILKKY